MKVGVKSQVSRRSVLKGIGATTAASVFPASRRALAQKKSIRVLVVADPFYYALNGVAGQFREETGIEASIESLSYDALQARLVSSFVSGQPDADVISVDNIWLGQFVDEGITANLDSYYANWADKADIVPAYANSTIVKGSQYAVWFYSDIRLMVWNVKLSSSTRVTTLIEVVCLPSRSVILFLTVHFPALLVQRLSPKLPVA